MERLAPWVGIEFTFTFSYKPGDCSVTSRTRTGKLDIAKSIGIALGSLLLFLIVVYYGYNWVMRYIKKLLTP
jgi:hypothetical protein